MSDFTFQCSSCGQFLEAPADMKGMFVECPKCREVIKVADAADKSPAPKADPEPKPRENDPAEEDKLKGTTIRINLPPNLGIPEAPKRKLTIRRNNTQ